jgi:TonB family protein
MKTLILLFILFPILASGQKKDTVIKFLDENFEFTTQKNSVYVGVAVKRPDSWFFYALYPDTTPLMKAYYKDKTLKIKEGPYIFYYPKNRKAREGTYHNNIMFGVWRFWYANGILKDSGRVKDNILVGHWKSWYPDGRLMVDCSFKDDLSKDIISMQPAIYLNNTNNHLIPLVTGYRNGPFTRWYQNGHIETKGSFLNNNMEGEWRWYYENGQPSTIELYKNGKVEQLQCFDSTGKETGDFCSLEKAALLKKFGDYKAYIYQNLTWPEEAIKNRVEGEVKVSFRVNKKGQLENLVVVSDSPLLKKTVEEIFATMTEWYPAVSHNRVVDSDEEFLIPFRLKN